MESTDKKLGCLSCGVSTDFPKKFLNHCKTHGISQGRYFCGYCGSFADSVEEFMKHPENNKKCTLRTFCEMFSGEA
nr:hypothetical protein MarFTME_104 [Marseillevirus futianmevirus]